MENTLASPLILFIPAIGMYAYVRGLAVLGDALKKRGGIKVYITRCTGQMLRYTMMARAFKIYINT